MKYYLYWDNKRKYDDHSTGLFVAESEEAIEEFINSVPEYEFILIKGSELKIKAVTRVTKLEVEW